MTQFIHQIFYILSHSMNSNKAIIIGTKIPLTHFLGMSLTMLKHYLYLMENREKMTKLALRMSSGIFSPKELPISLILRQILSIEPK